jgi:uncharacterized membrane protein
MGAFFSILSTVVLSPFVIGITYVVSRAINIKITNVTTKISTINIYLVLLFTAWLFSMSKLSLATGGLTEQENKNERIFYPLSILFSCIFISLLVVKNA